MNEEKQNLVDQKNAGDALREIQNHHGWPEIVNILSEMYQENIVSLIDRERPEVRAKIQAIEELATRINLKIDFGKAAAEELKTQKFNLMQPTP